MLQLCVAVRVASHPLALREWIAIVARGKWFHAEKFRYVEELRSRIRASLSPVGTIEYSITYYEAPS